MMPTKEESHALRALKDGRYEEAYRICAGVKKESFAPPGILFLGASALMGLGHIHEAQTWIADLKKTGGQDLPVLYLEAFFQLHARRVDQALLLWTRIIHLFPADTFADSLIERARFDEDRILADIEKPGALLRFVPLDRLGPDADKGERPRRARIALSLPRWFWKSALASAALIAAFFIGWQVFESRNPLSGLEDTLPEAPSTGSVISDKEYKEARYHYKNKDEVIRDYKDARQRIVKGEVNKGRVILSKIELSNASFELKERAKLLRDAVPIVPRRQFSDNVTVRQVLAESDLYQGAQVFWKAVAGESVGVENKTQFLAVDPSDKDVKILVRCECPPPKQGEPVEIFGKIERIRRTQNEIIVQAVD